MIIKEHFEGVWLYYSEQTKPTLKKRGTKNSMGP